MISRQKERRVGKSILILCLIILLCGAIGWGSYMIVKWWNACPAWEYILSKDELKMYTVEELKEVYEDEREAFFEVAEILLKNDRIAQIIKNSGEGVTYIDDTSKKDCFSEAEWERIVDLFHTTGLGRIERNRKTGKEIVRFIYRKGDEDIELYYGPCSTEDDMLYYRQRRSKWVRIDDHCWIGYIADSEIAKVWGIG